MDKVRIGIIGLGNRSSLADFWASNERSEVIAGVDVEPERLVEFREKMGHEVLTTDDYRVMLARNDIDAVAVLSPDSFHAEHAVAALRAGKHVFLEKPLATSVEDCDLILRAWRASGKRLMVGFNMRYMDMYRKMKEIVDSREIGEVRAVWVRHFVGMGSDFYFHDWHACKSNTTSLLLQKGSHDIDMIHWITNSFTKRVAAFGSLDFFGGKRPNYLTCPECPDKDTCNESSFGPRVSCVFRREVDAEDNCVTIMELENGIKATYNECHFTADGERNYVFIGTEGQMENSELTMSVWVKHRRHAGALQQDADVVYDMRINKNDDHTHGGADPLICEDFIDMVLCDATPVASPIAGRMSVAAGVAAAQSLRKNGMPVNVEPIDWTGGQRVVDDSMNPCMPTSVILTDKVLIEPDQTHRR